MKRRIPLTAWVILAVVGVHLAAFWLLADKHFLPKVRRVPAPPPPADFAARQYPGTLDPRTGETVIESEYVVSTELRAPSPARRPKKE